MSKFQVGDKVQVTESCLLDIVGKEATVIKVCHTEIHVQFDFYDKRFERSQSIARKGYGRVFSKDMLQLVEDFEGN